MSTQRPALWVTRALCSVFLLEILKFHYLELTSQRNSELRIKVKPQIWENSVFSSKWRFKDYKSRALSLGVLPGYISTYHLTGDVTWPRTVTSLWIRTNWAFTWVWLWNRQPNYQEEAGYFLPQTHRKHIDKEGRESANEQACVCSGFIKLLLFFNRLTLEADLWEEEEKQSLNDETALVNEAWGVTSTLALSSSLPFSSSESSLLNEEASLKDT